MAKLGRLGGATAVACLMLGTFATAVSAECFPGDLPLEAGEHLTVGTAFLASVTEASDDVDPNPDSAEYDWHLELVVEARYVGNVADALVFNGWDSSISCAEFHGDALTTGDKIIIAAEGPRALEGQIVVWHETSTGWAFYEDALSLGTDPDFYPPAARAAVTKSDILEFISSNALPETATRREVPPSRGESSMAVVTMCGFLLGLAFAMHRVRRAT